MNLVVGALIGALLVGGILERYPAGGQSSQQYVALGVAALVTLGGLAGWLAIWGSRLRARDATGSTRQGVNTGVILGTLWIIEIAFNNLVPKSIATESARFVVQNGIWAVIAVAMVAVAVLNARRDGRVGAGLVSGFWAGLVSGLIACLMALLVVNFWLADVLADPFSIQEWAERGPTSGVADAATYFAYQTMGGGILHLLVLGVAMGTVLGLVGGVIGRIFGAAPEPQNNVTR